MLIYFYRIRDRIREKKKTEKNNVLQKGFILSLDNIKKPMEKFLDNYLSEREWYHDDGDLRFHIDKDELSLEEVIDNTPSSLLTNKRTHIFDYSCSMSIHTSKKAYDEAYSSKNRTLYLSLIGAIEELFKNMEEENKNTIVFSFSETLKKIEDSISVEGYNTFINSDKQKRICLILKEIKETCELLTEKQKNSAEEDLEMKLEYATIQKEKIKMLTRENF